MSQVTVEYGVRSLRIKTTPSMLIKEVKRLACEKLGLNDEDWSVSTIRGGVVNESLPFRLTNLGKNAKLQLIKAKKKVKKENVVVKVNAEELPEGFSDSLVSEFGPGTSVYAILRYFEKKSGIKFTEREKSGYWEMPEVQTFNSQLKSIEELGQSLEILGIVDGKTALRVRFKMTNIKIDEAKEKLHGLNSEITMMEKFDDKKLTGKVKEDSKSQDVKKEQVEEGKSVPAPSENINIDSSNTIVNRNAQVFVPSEKEREIPDDDTDNATMNTAQFQKYRKQLNAQSGLSEQENGTLTTKRLREKDAVKPAKVFEKITVRVRFPDQTHIQAQFNSTETIGHLYEFVKSNLNTPNIAFLLLTAQPTRYLADPNQVLGGDELQFNARQLVYFEWDDKEGAKTGILKQDVLNNAKDIAEDDSIKLDEAKPVSNSPQNGEEKGTNNNNVDDDEAERERKKKEKLAKFFKLGLRK